MIHMINPHSMDKTGIPLRITGMSLDMKERESTASLTLDDREGISNKQITGMWFYDDQDPGAGMVWRARSMTESLHTKTPVVQLEHIICTLKDTILFDEVTPATITGNKNATTVSAKQAMQYILDKQETKDWKLYSFDPSYDDVSQGYSFEGDTLYDALVTVSSTLEGCWWQFDTKHYPFRLYILNHTTLPWTDTMLRAGRNLRTISVTTDKSGMYTRFWPVGKDDLHLTSSKKYKNDYILSSKANTYGVIDHTETDASIETASDLAAFARARLRKHHTPVVKIEVEGLELADATMTPEDRIILGGLCEIVIGETGQKYTEKIIEKSYPDKMNTPELVKITLSNKQDDVAKIIAQEKKKQAKSSRVQARQSKQTREILYNTVKEVKVDGPDKNNKYKLQFKLVKDVDWQDGETFSRAVTGWGVSAAGGTITVTAKPQGQSKKVQVKAGTASRSGSVFTAPIQMSEDGKTWKDTGAAPLTVNASDLYKDGWRDAYQKVVWPEEGTTMWLTIKAPAAYGARPDQQSVDYRVAVDDSYAYIKMGAGNLVMARTTNSAYGHGWAAAYGRVVWPSPATGVSMTVKAPAGYGSTPDQQSVDYRVTVDDNYAYIKLGAGDDTMARVKNSAYGHGWDAAKAKVKWPSSGTTQTMTVKAPASYGSTPQQQSVDYCVTCDASYAYIRMGTTQGEVMARTAQYFNKSGTIVYDHYDFSQGQFVYWYKQTVSSQSDAIVQSGSRTVRYRT